jgi:transposase
MVRVLGGEERQGGVTARRRRSYTAEQKRELVEATMQPGASVSMVAQRHDINANLLFTWRRQMREGQPGTPGATPERAQFIPLGVVGGDATGRASVAVVSQATEPVEARSTTRLERHKPRRGSCRIEIELPNRVRLRVEEPVEVEALRQVIAALKGAW